eukprot:CAMPEP_0183775738 /NCGR_PEP_ID=MMETSP0739-20130205/45146_1 /TAXON_ID=385413 /ORGANISM="Thalassiosira miniscula, Strain CCMP1093" /LENGTH=41 /DNA_ID= /DNA_START= /DNA_END= /DNA_ORIENTATION=
MNVIVEEKSLLEMQAVHLEQGNGRLDDQNQSLKEQLGQLAH